ncbi:cytochrome P450 [Muricauda sp. CAU 1633]|uniref:cytochrome P450 n=1 Tax=Allomuricauda sp. CAU 1633 TaxID=2816036 RepID=UPI001A90A099|nr:cytochrome P450 [Muricauda sp. CAU 1633]MBO0321333.1 cytochrome P450 [Muricauda sp. CAU 1633]
MKKGILFFFGACLFLACGEKVVEQPENLIPKDEMTHILFDLSILNTTQSSFSSVFDKTGIDIMEFLYEKYDIDSTQFAQSDLYYASIPLEYQSIYEDVDAMIEKRKNALEAATKKRNDSIRDAQTHRRDSIQALEKEKDSVTP